MKPAGLVLAAMAGLWIAYLVPHRLRYRQQLLECRTDDRFSEQLRVVRVAGRARREAGRPARPAQALLHPPGARGRGGTVDRPHSATDRAAADAVRRTAADRARLAQQRAVRRSRARRRAALASILLLLTVAGWSAVAFIEAAVALAAAPTVLLTGVLVLGRRAVIVGRRSDAAPAPVRVRRTVAPVAIGRAVRPSDADTEVMEAVVVDVESSVAPAARPAGATGADEATWVPVPVPVPAYSLKPAVRRAAPAPLVLDEAPPAEEAPVATAEPGTPSLDLDAVLARRRASGE